jgi:predicted transcriptional regulator
LPKKENKYIIKTILCSLEDIKMQHKEILSLFEAFIKSNDTFIEKFKEYLRDKNMTITKFCDVSGIPESTIYKIMSDPTKDFRVSTFRQMIQEVMNLEGHENGASTIGIITTRHALDAVGRNFSINGKDIQIKEYPATTIEEEIIQGVRAEREGVAGIICGPVAATTMEKIVNIPVISIHFEEKLLVDAITNISKKL